MNRILYFLSIVFIVIGCLTILIFLNKADNDGFDLSGITNYEITGQFGDFVGGVVGTLFALSGTFLIFLTFNEQKKENQRISFESSFFQMINLHRENIKDAKLIINQKDIIENRDVYKQIFFDFIECYREVKKFSNSTNISDYLTPKYAEKLKKITKNINPKINLIELAIIDISYSIVFYGLNTEGISVIRKNFLKKYNSNYYFKLLFYIKLKPKVSNEEYYMIWEEFRALDLKNMQKIVTELYGIRKKGRKTELDKLGLEFQKHQSYDTFYSGYQSILGHYFRHLYQSFKFLNENKILDKSQKYSYAKLLRAQLSTFEQALLMINSLSSLGMKWEYNPEVYTDFNIDTNLITTYNIIKNLPGEHFYGIRYKHFYPKVDFEILEQL